MSSQKIIDHGIKSVKWTALGRVLPMALRPFLSVWLALILDPNAYGIVAIASVFIGLSRLIQGLGLSEFLIKAKKENEIEINSAFWSNIFIAIIIYLILVIASPFISTLYNIDQLEFVIPVLSLIIIFNSFGFIPQSILTKKMSFKKLFMIQIIPLLSLLAFTIPLAYLGFGVWALVIGTLINSFLENIFYLFFSKWNPKFIFSFEKFREMFQFGKWIVIQKNVEYFYYNIDLFLAGIFFNTYDIGLYSVGKNFIRMIYTSVNGPVGAIVLPMFSKLQADSKNFGNYLLSITKKLSFLNIPILVGLFIISEDLTSFLFKNKWDGLGTLMSVLVIGEGLSRNFWAHRDLLQILNRPEVYPKSILINLFVSLFLYLFLGNNDIATYALVFTINNIIYCILQILIIRVELKVNILDILKSLLTSSICSSIMGILLFLSLKYFPINLSLTYLIALVIISVLIFVSLMYLIDNKEFKSYVSIVKKIF